MLTVMKDQSYKYDYSEYMDCSLNVLLSHHEQMIKKYIKDNKLNPNMRIEKLTHSYSKLRAVKRELDRRGFKYD